jgi:hypothetical protein
MPYEQINRGRRTPEEARGYREVMQQALHKVVSGSGELAVRSTLATQDEEITGMGLLARDMAPLPKPTGQVIDQVVFQ